MADVRLFEEIIEFPDLESGRKYDLLVGLDDIKRRLTKESEILLNPGLLTEWSLKKHGRIIPLVKLFENRNSLFIFSGDIGTGKSTLAETFGEALARHINHGIAMFKLSLTTRGTGAPGEMTKFISMAFSEIKSYAAQLRKPDGMYNSACILLIDEADALAQSRELIQMQHEDRAGVDALIQGVDTITKSHMPIITVMCTNRIVAIDPAVRRRAAAIFEFNRPSDEQRKFIFQNYLDGSEIPSDDIELFAKLTGPNDKRKYGYTFSDIIQKVLPALVLDTFPDEQITKERMVELIEKIPPTPPFNEHKVSLAE